MEDRVMGYKYEQCYKSHGYDNGKWDGCQEFMPNPVRPLDCVVCGCHGNFHRKNVEYKTEVVYADCKRTLDFTHATMVDGCQQFTPKGGEAAIECAACGCHKAFHQHTRRVPSTS